MHLYLMRPNVKSYYVTEWNYELLEILKIQSYEVCGNDEMWYKD